MRRLIFCSFHYKPDNWRAGQVRSMGTVEGNEPVSDNDWEEVTGGGGVTWRSRNGSPRSSTGAPAPSFLLAAIRLAANGSTMKSSRRGTRAWGSLASAFTASRTRIRGFRQGAEIRLRTSPSAESRQTLLNCDVLQPIWREQQYTLRPD